MRLVLLVGSSMAWLRILVVVRGLVCWEKAISAYAFGCAIEILCFALDEEISWGRVLGLHWHLNQFSCLALDFGALGRLDMYFINKFLIDKNYRS